MRSILEKPMLQTGSSGDNIVPPTDIPQRNGDGEGDGRAVAQGLAEAEAFANSNIREVSGVHVANYFRGVGRHEQQRAAFAVPTGHITMRYGMPPSIN